MLTVAKMNWNVQRRCLGMRGNDGTPNTVALDNYRAIVREDTEEVFQIATKKYQPVQNSEIVDFFREFCEAGHASMETVGGIRGGAVVWALARLNGGSTEMIGANDEVRGYMLLASSHDGSVRTIGKATQTRVVCWNTLTAAFGEKTKQEFKMKHSKKFTSAVRDEAQKTMGMAINQVKETNGICRKLAATRIDDSGRIEFVSRLLGGESILDQVVNDSSRNILDAVVDASQYESGAEVSRVGKAILDAIIESPGSELVTANGTLWGAVNGVTYFADHVRGRSQDQRLQNAWFGNGDVLKTKAMEVAKDMAGI